MRSPASFLWASTIVLCLTPIASAAPGQASLPQLEDLLSLPLQNRLQVAEKKKQELLPGLKEIAFSDKNSMNTRWKAISLAAHLAPEQAEELALKAIRDDQWYMRNAGLVVASSLGLKKARGIALELLKDPALVVRSAAVDSLAPHATSSREVRQALWTELFAPRNFRKGQSLWIRKQIVEVLVRNMTLAEKPMLSRLKGDNDQSIRTLALNALK